MDSDVIKFPQPEEKPPKLLIGPFEEYRVVVDDRVIPRLTGNRDGAMIWLTVDRRFTYAVPEEHALGVAWLIANALAIGEGYTHLGAQNKDRPFAPIGMQVGSIKTDEGKDNG